jgi:hypothetical protein
MSHSWKQQPGKVGGPPPQRGIVLIGQDHELAFQLLESICPEKTRVGQLLSLVVVVPAVQREHEIRLEIHQIHE